MGWSRAQQSVIKNGRLGASLGPAAASRTQWSSVSMLGLGWRGSTRLEKPG